MSVISVPGVAVQAELDRPLSWRGRWRGDEVDVVVLAVSDEPAVREAAVAALQPLVGLAPGCRAAVLCHEGVALIAAPVRGRLLSSLPPLSPGHAVAVGVAVSGVLESLHARGLVWGGAYDEVLVSDDGAVGLPLHGVAQRRLAGERRTPRDDVRALGATLVRSCPSLVVPEDPGDARSFARALRRQARPAALRLAGAAAGSARSAVVTRSAGRVLLGSRRRSAAIPRDRRTLPVPSLRLAVAGVGVVALVGVGLAGWAHHRPETFAAQALPSRTPSTSPAATATPSGPATPSTGRSALTSGSPRTAGPSASAAPTSPAAWRATVDALDHVRADALGGHRPLTDADAAGSSALAADSAVATQLASSAPRTTPPVEVISALSVVSADATTAVLRVTDSLPAFAYLDATGRAVATSPARAARTWTITVTRTASGWRFTSVS